MHEPRDPCAGTAEVAHHLVGCVLASLHRDDPPSASSEASRLSLAVDRFQGVRPEGPDVLLIGGLGDTVESWQFQLDQLRRVRSAQTMITSARRESRGSALNSNVSLTVCGPLSGRRPRGFRREVCS